MTKRVRRKSSTRTRRSVKSLEHVLKKKKTATRKRSVKRAKAPVKHHKTTPKSETVYAKISEPKDFHIKTLQARKEVLAFFQKLQEFNNIRMEKAQEDNTLEDNHADLIDSLKMLKHCFPHVNEKKLPISAEEVRLEEEMNATEGKINNQEEKQKIADLQHELQHIEDQINRL